jgi:hypothetical protein
MDPVCSCLRLPRSIIGIEIPFWSIFVPRRECAEERIKIREPSYLAFRLKFLVDKIGLI